jgi:hypothetical protein
MTDIATLIARLLPFAVIGGLALIFYMLDVFAVRPGFDAPATKVAARQVTATEKPASPSAARSSPVPPPSAPSPAAAEPANKFAGESESPPQAEAQPQGEAPEPMPPPTASMNQGLSGSPAPRYMPPAANGPPAPALGMNPPAQDQQPSEEIPPEDAQRIESESLQALDQAEQEAAQQGAIEEEQQQPQQ